MTDYIQSEVGVAFEFDDPTAQWDRLPEKAKRQIEEQNDRERRENIDDRAEAIIAAANLDDALRQLLAAFMIDDDKEVRALLDGDSPLSTFSARTKAAYCLGLLDKETYRELNLLRKIRNHFAHGSLGQSFDEPPVRDWINALRRSELADNRVFEHMEESLRDKFDTASNRVLSSLKMTADRIPNADKRSTLSWLPTTARVSDNFVITSYADSVIVIAEAYHRLLTAGTQEELSKAVGELDLLMRNIEAGMFPGLSEK